jgi:hypothetical protein
MHVLKGNEAHPNALPQALPQANQAIHSIPNVSSNFPVSMTESHQIQAPNLAKFQSPNSAHTTVIF